MGADAEYIANPDKTNIYLHRSRIRPKIVGFTYGHSEQSKCNVSLVSDPYKYIRKNKSYLINSTDNYNKSHGRYHLFLLSNATLFHENLLHTHCKETIIKYVMNNDISYCLTATIIMENLK